MESATWRSVVTVSSSRGAGGEDGGDESEMSTERGQLSAVRAADAMFGEEKLLAAVVVVLWPLPGTTETIVCAHQSQQLPQPLVGCVGSWGV